MQNNILDELDHELEAETYLRNVLQGCRQLKPPFAGLFAGIEDALDEQQLEKVCNEFRS